jgi:hypothetical protein
MVEIRTAQRKQSKLRIGLSSPSGGGKTYSALLLAKGLTKDWKKIGMIDSENGRGDIYSDFGDYQIMSLKPPFTPEAYIEAIRAFEQAGVDVIIVDSVTHEWDGEGGCLQINEKLANLKFRGNSWAAWSETTPRHQKFLDAITSSKCHVITTVRNKVDTNMNEGKVKKVGVKEIQREGFEYELTVNFNIDRESHEVMASKDNTQLFEGKDPFVITEKTGKLLSKWVMEGALTEEQKEAKRKEEAIKKVLSVAKSLGHTKKWLEGRVGNILDKTIDFLEKLETKLQAKLDAKLAKQAKKADPVSKAIKKSAVKHTKNAKKSKK